MNPNITFDQAIAKAASLIRNARSVVALTGAGISTPSGIPDFRSPGTGEWTRVDPMKVASLTAFRQRPKDFFDWLRPLAKKSWEALPNPAHIGLAELEKKGKLEAVITQNIDGLHQQAGSERVLELHGSMRTCTCHMCRKNYALELVKEEFLAGGFPRCPTCNSILKPDVVLYEEMLPMDVWEYAHSLCENADLMLVIGTALEVVPAGGLPFNAVQHGAKLIINTFSETYLDARADVLLPYDVARAIPEIVAIL